MAAAVVPLIAGLAPEIIKLIAGLVHKQAPVAEKLGPGTGPVKFASVFGSVMEALTAAATAGQISKALPSDEIVKVIIQAVVSSMQLSGILGPAPGSVPDVPASTSLTPVILRPGQSIVITVQ